MATPLISFIVSAFDRPASLRCCLASLALQDQIHETMIADNGASEGTRLVCEEIAVDYYETNKLKQKGCYASANYMARVARAEWLCFPSDDSYYVPSFARLMLAKSADADLVYCDWLDTRLQPYYKPFRAEPRTGAIDKTAFIVRRGLFLRLGGFTDPEHEFADGHFVDAVVRSGARIAKAEGVLLVHS